MVKWLNGNLLLRSELEVQIGKKKKEILKNLYIFIIFVYYKLFIFIVNIWESILKFFM